MFSSMCRSASQHHASGLPSGFWQIISTNSSIALSQGAQLYSQCQSILAKSRQRLGNLRNPANLVSNLLWYRLCSISLTALRFVHFQSIPAQLTMQTPFPIIRCPKFLRVSDSRILMGQLITPKESVMQRICEGFRT